MPLLQVLLLQVLLLLLLIKATFTDVKSLEEQTTSQPCNFTFHPL